MIHNKLDVVLCFFCHDLWTCLPHHPGPSHITRAKYVKLSNSLKKKRWSEVRTRTMPAAVNLKAQVPGGKIRYKARRPTWGRRCFFSPPKKSWTPNLIRGVDSWNPEKDLNLEKPSCLFLNVLFVTYFEGCKSSNNMFTCGEFFFLKERCFQPNFWDMGISRILFSQRDFEGWVTWNVWWRNLSSNKVVQPLPLLNDSITNNITTHRFPHHFL